MAAAHALSSESVLERGAGVMVDESSGLRRGPARPHPNGDLLPAGRINGGLYFPPQNKRRDGLRLRAITEGSSSHFDHVVLWEE